MFKWDNFNIKLHIVSKPLRLVLAIVSLLEQNNTQLLSLHLKVGVTIFLSGVCELHFDFLPPFSNSSMVMISALCSINLNYCNGYMCNYVDPTGIVCDCPDVSTTNVPVGGKRCMSKGSFLF